MLAGALVSHVFHFFFQPLFIYIARLAYQNMRLCTQSIVSKSVPQLTSAHLIFMLLRQTRMQVFSASPLAVYSGMGNAFTRISSTEGMRALWRGVSSVVLGAGPAHAVHFGTLEAVKELAGGNRGGQQWLATCESFVTISSRLVC